MSRNDDSTPFDRNEGVIVVVTRLTGPGGSSVARLALDTGASVTSISQEAMALAGYDPAASAPNQVQMTTASGVETVPLFLVERVEALSRECADLPVLCHTLPPGAGVDGVLGLNFFTGRRLTIDFNLGIITVE